MVDRTGSRSKWIAGLVENEEPEFQYEDEVYAVRPYTVTGGGVRSDTANFPVEALVEALAGSAQRTGLMPGKRGIIELTSSQYLSIAVLSAYIELPVAVVGSVVPALV